MPDTNTQPFPPLPEPALLKTLDGEYTDEAPYKWAWFAHGHDTGMTPYFTLEQVRAAILADRGRGEPVATVEVIEVDDPHLRPAHHVALHKLLPHGTKLYAVRAAMGGDVQAELLKSLRAYADSEYIKGLNVCKTNECLGEDQKMTFGTFGKAELEAHRKAARHFGAHFGIHEAIRAAASIGADGGSER